MNSSFPALFWFVAILAAIPLVLWLLKRTQLGTAAAGGGAMRVVAVLPLSPGQRIVTVEVGTGEARRWLVLGVTAQTITTLREMEPGAEPPAPGAPPVPGFGQLLAKVRRDG